MLIRFTLFFATFAMAIAAHADGGSDYADLLVLFDDWREFESPPLLDGAPDYTEERFASRAAEFESLRTRLHAFETNDWPVPQQVDWHLIRAEMNGYDFNRRVLKPWARDPAFYDTLWSYRSDVPGHEGPTHHALVEVWTYEFPLSDAEARRLTAELRVVPPLMQQARRNLTGNARDLWVTGTRVMRGQLDKLNELKATLGDTAGEELLGAVDAAYAATAELVAWLEAELPSKTGPSGIGKDNYTWYQQNVHLVPLTWDDEVRLLERELARAWSSLMLEEQRNRDLPPMRAANSPAEYDALANEAVERIMNFLRARDIVTVTDYMEPAMREHMGSFVPADKRNFFQITAHYDPAPLFTHFWHWFELARMDIEPHPSPVRQGPLLYNIFDSRNEGTATGVEEMLMHAGLYDDRPRSRELVWIMLAQRAARGLGSLYAHANDMTMEEAGKVHMDWTPRGWMKTEKDLLIFEQHLYLRQPGYGTAYVTGKYLLEKTLADYAHQAERRGEKFELREFFDRLHAIDSIPISLGRWELTGLDDLVPRNAGPTAAAAPEQAARTIALTFDDVTRSDGPFFSGTERTRRLIAALSLADVEGAMFFVTTNNVAKAGEDGAARLRAYTDAGHVLGNHSHSHQWLSRVDTDAYIADLDEAIERLAAFDSVTPYYRFPFLDEGRVLDKRDALREALQERKLKNGYVTIDTYDWYLVTLARQAQQADVEFDIDDLRNLYVDVITRSTEFYDAMAQQTLGRSPHHVLLLHENDLAALFIGDLVTELRNRGFRVIPAKQAFTDPIAGHEPDTLFLGQGRIAALAHEAGQPPADLVSPTEDEEYLRRRFTAEVAALDAH